MKMSSNTPVQDLRGTGDNVSLSWIEKYVNRDFGLSMIGVLQLTTLFTGLLVVALIGNALNHSAPDSSSYWNVLGHSFYFFLFLVAFWCFMTTLIIYFCAVTSFRTSELLPKTTFYVAYHVMASLLYLFGTLALLVEASEMEDISVQKGSNVKGQVIGGGAIGAITTGLYTSISVFAIRRYRKERAL